MVDVQLALHNLLEHGVEIHLAPNGGMVDVTLAKYWSGVRCSKTISVADFLDSGKWLKSVISAGEELTDVLRNK